MIIAYTFLNYRRSCRSCTVLHIHPLGDEGNGETKKKWNKTNERKFVKHKTELFYKLIYLSGGSTSTTIHPSINPTNEQTNKNTERNILTRARQANCNGCWPLGWLDAGMQQQICFIFQQKINTWIGIAEAFCANEKWTSEWIELRKQFTKWTQKTTTKKKRNELCPFTGLVL